MAAILRNMPVPFLKRAGSYTPPMSRGFWVAMGLVAAGTLALWAYASPAARSTSTPAPAPQIDHRAEFRALIADIRVQADHTVTWGRLLNGPDGPIYGSVCDTLARAAKRQADDLTQPVPWRAGEREVKWTRRWARNSAMYGKLVRTRVGRHKGEAVDCSPPFRLALALNRAAAYAENHPTVLEPEPEPQPAAASR